jgi:hypothetical protein
VQEGDDLLADVAPVGYVVFNSKKQRLLNNSFVVDVFSAQSFVNQKFAQGPSDLAMAFSHLELRLIHKISVSIILVH